jgi:hypothetical protein
MKKKPCHYTKHQLKRMSMRGISKNIVNAVLAYGEWRDGSSRFSYEVEYKGVVVVLYEQKEQYNISSCKLNRKLTQEAERIHKEHKIDFLKAVHRVIKNIDFSKEIFVLNNIDKS